MDQKTLEYMGERVDKARSIQRCIKELEHFINYAEEKQFICLIDRHNNGPRIIKSEYPRLFSKAIESVVKEIQDEIKQLEQELAEL